MRVDDRQQRDAIPQNLKVSARIAAADTLDLSGSTSFMKAPGVLWLSPITHRNVVTGAGGPVVSDLSAPRQSPSASLLEAPSLKPLNDGVKKTATPAGVTGTIFESPSSEALATW